MSPYVASAVEIVSTFGTSAKRKKILAHWLDHRADLRAVGFQQGFQWLDGSFVEDKDPNDLDVVTFVFRPPTAADDATFNAFLTANRHVIDPTQIKARYMLDVFFVDLNAFPESVVSVSRYWFGLFSHRRIDEIWKGMLQVRLEDVTDDLAARTILASAPLGGAVP
jgi:hypothetical protein